MSGSTLPAPAADLAQAMLGIWKLKTRIDLDASGQRRIDPALGADPLGVLCFAPGYFAAQFMRRDRSAAPGTAPVMAPSLNNSVAVDGYDAYFGTYVLDPGAGTIATTLDASVSPANIGKTFVRRVRVVNAELIIQLDTTAADGAAVTRTLRFSRLS
ncbi:MAG TPA: lipocalin-like domain-containing protein [Spirochaetia bacterium]|nr:lipocalin-like domain-containing protein [Spirochaetia bacterium]